MCLVIGRAGASLSSRITGAKCLRVSGGPRVMLSTMHMHALWANVSQVQRSQVPLAKRFVTASISANTVVLCHRQYQFHLGA